MKLMEPTHYIAVDDVSIISKKTLKEYFSPFSPLHYRDLPDCNNNTLLPDCNNIPELVLVA